VLPPVDALIRLLDQTLSADQSAQGALNSARECVRAYRAGYEREASLDTSLSDEQNEAEQEAAWRRTDSPCREWASREAELGV
jgi:hypothetical protein